MKTKEEIEKEAVELFPLANYDEHGDMAESMNRTIRIKQASFVKGALWMQEQLSQPKAEQPKGLSLEECKNRITQEYGLGQFYVLVKGSSEKRIDEAIEKVATLYLQSNKGWSDDKWVSVEDRLPKLNEHLISYDGNILIENFKATVIAYSPTIGILKAQLTKRGWDEVSSISVKNVQDVEKWMPLPTPPKSLTENKQP